VWAVDRPAETLRVPKAASVGVLCGGVLLRGYINTSHAIKVQKSPALLHESSSR